MSNKKPHKKKKYAFLGTKQPSNNSKKTLEHFGAQITQFYQEGQTEEALATTQQALISFPKNLTLLSNAGAFSLMLSNLELAKSYFLKVLKLNPNDAGTHNNLANLFDKQKYFSEAEKHYKKALEAEPNFVEARNNLAVLLVAQKRFDKAEQHYQKNLNINPNNSQTHSNFAALLVEQKRFNEAQQHYQKALNANSNNAEIYNNFANLFNKQGQFGKAKKYYQKALNINPNYVNAHSNLAVLFARKKQFIEAIEQCHTALKINPNHIVARFNLCSLQLILLNFEQGWQNYESRYHPNKKDKKTIPPTTPIPQYQGEDLEDKNILVYQEQGFGDEIQFIRYLPLLKNQKGVKEITLVCKPALKTLFSSIESIDHLLSKDEFEKTNIQNTQTIDYWVFIMSLPLHFNTTLETIPNTLPYLSSPQQQQDKWRDKLPQENNKINSNIKNLTIGLVWKGSKIHKNDENRSLSSLKDLKPLWDLKNKLKDKMNINFISLQKGEGEDEAQNPPTAQPLTHLGTDIQDFSDSAAIVSQLDLVICVDTAIAHLTGALNIPCWVLLPYHDTDWRWTEDREDSPWYPNIMKLFRQSQDSQWDSVIQNVVNDLKKLVHSEF